MQPTIATALIIGLAILAVYQRVEIAILSRDAAWGMRTQGAWHWRLYSLQVLALFRPVDLVHFDVDKLKTLNAVLGEERVNDLLRRAFRRSDAYRTQHGDECAALTRPGHGAALAAMFAARLAALPLTDDERAALAAEGVRGITVTQVIAPRVRLVPAALRRAVRAREALKAAGQRGETVTV